MVESANPLYPVMEIERFDWDRTEDLPSIPSLMKELHKKIFIALSRLLYWKASWMGTMLRYGFWIECTMAAEAIDSGLYS